MDLLKIFLEAGNHIKENSLGNPISDTDEGIENFWKWFGNSKVVDEQGRPLVCYHGTDKDFSSFDPIKMGSKDYGFLSQGFYFTADQETADAYANYHELENSGQNTMIVYLKIENPYYWTWEEPAIGNRPDAIKKRKELQSKGHDGVIYHLEDLLGTYQDIPFVEMVVFNSNNIKSVFNNGNFSNSHNISERKL